MEAEASTLASLTERCREYGAKPMEVPSSSAAALEEDDYEPNSAARRRSRLAAVRHRRPARAPASPGRWVLCSRASSARRRGGGGRVGVQQSQPARPAAFSPSKHFFRRAASWVRMEAELGVAGMEARCKLKSVLEQCARCERIERVPVLVVLLESVGASEAGDDVRAMVSDETAQMEATVWSTSSAIRRARSSAARRCTSRTSPS